MQMRRPLLISVGLSLFLAIVVSLAWWGDMPAPIMSTVPASINGSVDAQPESVAFSGQAEIAGEPVPANRAFVTNTVLVPINGRVDGLPESVTFSGQAQVASRLLAPDPSRVGKKPGRTAVELSIDLTGVTGMGLSSGDKYVISGPEILNRPLDASSLVQITFPFFPSGPEGMMSARSATVSFSFTFDLITGAITWATAQLTNT